LEVNYLDVATTAISYIQSYGKEALRLSCLHYLLSPSNSPKTTYKEE